MKKLVCIAFLIMGGFGLSAQGNMDVYNFTGDILLVQARATVNGTVVGYSRAMVMPNASAVIPSVSNDPNAEWEVVRGVDLATRRKYAIDYYSSGTNDYFQGLYIAWNSNTSVIFY